MRVLAIDTALTNCAAAVLDDSAASACLARCSEEIGRGHAEKLMGMISEVMDESKTAFVDLDRVVVTTGPGSFTGLRVGLSVARGFGLVLKIPVVGVTGLSAIAMSVADGLENAPILVAIDGKGDEVYCQEYFSDGTPFDRAGVRTLSDLSCSLSENIRFAGSAAHRIAEVVGHGKDRILSDQAYPDITEIARLGIKSDPKEAMAVPLYLRPPDATPQKSGRIARR